MSVSMLKLKDILREIAPLDLQEDWDNSGMQIDMRQSSVSRILVCMEITEKVVAEAAGKKADFIVTHHPLLFAGVKQIDRNDAAGRNLIGLISAGISVYSSHTCFDSAPGGNNDDLAGRLNLCNIRALGSAETQTGEAEPVQAFSMGAQGELETPMKLADFAQRLNQVLGQPGGIRVAGNANHMVQKVGLCTGAGGCFLPVAAAAGCDVYISGDLKHHEVQDAGENGLCVIDAGHYGTEHLFVENMAEKLCARLDGQAEVLESRVDVNPFDFVL